MDAEAVGASCVGCRVVFRGRGRCGIAEAAACVLVVLGALGCTEAA